jgi:peptide/nickel transport system permease protein
MNTEHLLTENHLLRHNRAGLFWRRLRGSHALLVGLFIFLVLLFFTLVGPLLFSGDPLAMNVSSRLQPPGGVGHLLGTDEFGRDLGTRLLHGGRVSLGAAFLVTALASMFGLLIGVYAACYRALDMLLMRICDGVAALPGILLAIALMAALGAAWGNVVIALTIVYTPSMARIVRAAALTEYASPYVEALYLQGASRTRIIWRHLIPSALSPLLVQATFIFAESILAEAALSFLGAGIAPPAPSWGNMLQAGKAVIAKAWWTVALPGVMVMLSVLSLNLVGDGLRDLLDRQTSL